VQDDSSLQDAVAAFQSGDLERARTLAGRQVAAAPSPQSLHLMGLIECRSGRVDSGVEWLSRASEADPNNLAYRVMLARALVDSGRHEEALAVAERPAGYTPPELALWHTRAEAADGAKAWDASAEAWATLTAARPNDWRAWSNRANALGELGRWSEAAEALRHAAEANPSELPLRRALATALARAGRYQESADELGRWVDASPDDVGTRIMFARLLADLGREDESNAQLDKATELAGAADPDGLMNVLLTKTASAGSGEADITGVRELAQLLDRTNRMEALERLLDRAEDHGLQRDQLGYPAAAAALRQGKPGDARRILLAQPPETDPIRWHWLMGRIADALGETDVAFAEAEAMNRSENDFESWRARGERHLALVRQLEAGLTFEWAARLKTLPAHERGTLAFLVGFPRSGTTLLDTFLLGHPDTEVLEEVPLFEEARRILGDMPELPERSEMQLSQAREAYFAELACHVDPAFRGLVVDKMPLNMLAAPYLYSLFPGARFIFARRHPCDAVLSCFMQGFAMNDSMACFLDIRMAAEYYDAAMRLWTRSKEVLPIQVCTIVYEELIADPEASLKPLIDFLGLDWRGELLDHRSTAKARAAIGTPSFNQVTQPLTRAPSGRWKRYEKQLEPVLPILLPWAERLGYSD
jgi:tetratricopeptide (TPR) repeat protein